MRTVKIDLPKFIRYLRPRYVFFTFLSIILFNTMFGLMNIFPSYHPIGSIYDGGDYGYYDAFSSLPIPAESLTSSLTDFKFSSTTLLVIITPRIQFQEHEMKYIRDLRKMGQPMLFIGSEKLFAVNNFANYALGLEYIGAERLLDYKNYGDTPFDMVVKLPSSSESFYAANAYAIYSSEGISAIETMYTSSPTYCTEKQVTCRDTRSIAIVNRNSMLIADDLMLRNKHVNRYPNNLKLLPALLAQYFPNVDRITFDETHLLWAAVNQAGLQSKIRELAYNPSSLIIVGVLSLLLPLLIALRTRVISSPSTKERGILARRIMKRFEVLHTENMISVPLTLEEKILTSELLNRATYGVAYLSLVARRMYDYIVTQKLDELIPDNVLGQLQGLSHTYYPPNMAWRIIESANMAIEEADKMSATMLTKGV